MSEEKEEDLDEWLEKKIVETKTVVVHRENATDEEWKELLDHLDEESWDYETE